MQLDDAYLGGERPGVGGRGSPNKVPLVAAVSTNDKGHPMRTKLGAIMTLSREAVATWARANLLPGCDVPGEGLACFAGVIDAGRAPSYIGVDTRKPRELPQFTCMNTVLSNLKTMAGGAHKWFRFRKYAQHYLGAFGYRFNNRFDLGAMLTATISQATTRRPTRERQVRGMAEVHD